MESREERRKRLRKASQEAAAKTDSLLDEALAALKEATTAKLEALRPRIKDEAAFNQLLAAVAETTRRNESLAEFKNRMEKLGQGVRAVAKDILAMLNR